MEGCVAILSQKRLLDQPHQRRPSPSQLLRIDNFLWTSGYVCAASQMVPSSHWVTVHGCRAQSSCQKLLKLLRNKVLLLQGFSIENLVPEPAVASCSQLIGMGWQVLLKHVPVFIVPIQDRYIIDRPRQTKMYTGQCQVPISEQSPCQSEVLYLSICFILFLSCISEAETLSRCLRNTTSKLMGLPFCRLQATPSILAMFCPCAATPKQWLGTSKLTSSTINISYQTISDSWDDFWNINELLISNMY